MANRRLHVAGRQAVGVCETALVEEESSPGFAALGLFALPAPGSEISGWIVEEGVPLFGCEPGEEACFVAVFEEEGENAKVTANFSDEPGEPLTLKIEEGSGTVVSNPAGLECVGGAPKSCSKSFEGTSHPDRVSGSGLRLQRLERLRHRRRHRPPVHGDDVLGQDGRREILQGLESQRQQVKRPRDLFHLARRGQLRLRLPLLHGRLQRRLADAEGQARQELPLRGIQEWHRLGDFLQRRDDGNLHLRDVQLELVNRRGLRRKRQEHRCP